MLSQVTDQTEWVSNLRSVELNLPQSPWNGCNGDSLTVLLVSEVLSREGRLQCGHSSQELTRACTYQVKPCPKPSARTPTNTW